MQIRAVTGLSCEYNLRLDYLCPVCLVLIILITASTAQDCLNLESGQLNTSLCQWGLVAAVSRLEGAGTGCGFRLASESHEIFQEDHRTKRHKEVTLSFSCYF